MKDLLRGLLWGLLIDLTTVVLIAVLLANGASLAWAPALLWAMAALAVTGIALAEGRYLIAAGFWLLQLVLCTLYLAGFVKLLALLT